MGKEKAGSKGATKANSTLHHRSIIDFTQAPGRDALGTPVSGLFPATVSLVQSSTGQGRAEQSRAELSRKLADWLAVKQRSSEAVLFLAAETHSQRWHGDAWGRYGILGLAWRDPTRPRTAKVVDDGDVPRLEWPSGLDWLPVRLRKVSRPPTSMLAVSSRDETRVHATRPHLSRRPPSIHIPIIPVCLLHLLTNCKHNAVIGYPNSNSNSKPDQARPEVLLCSVLSFLRPLLSSPPYSGCKSKRKKQKRLPCMVRTLFYLLLPSTNPAHPSTSCSISSRLVRHRMAFPVVTLPT